MATAAQIREADAAHPPNLIEVDMELAERKLRHFIPQAWPAIEPKEFAPGWHIDAMAEHLQAITEGQIRNLIITVPPRHTKSLTVAVMWNAWEWGPRNLPQTRWLFSAYAAQLSIRDSVRCRRLIQSPWYQIRWGDRYGLTGDQNAKGRYDNNKGGYRLATSVAGLGTGEGGDRIVVDDPHDVNQAYSTTMREWIISWWDHVMSTRHNDPKVSSRVIVMQRVHAADLVGHIKETTGDDYEMLVLPAERETKVASTSIGFRDPRKKPGDLLWEDRYGEKEIAEKKRELGSFDYAAQFQQRPSPEEGGIFKRHWWRFYHKYPNLAEMDFMFAVWDMAFKDKPTSSFVLGQIWGVKGADRILFDQTRDRLSFTKTLVAVISLDEKWPDAVAKYVEAKANGDAVMDTLKTRVSGLIPWPEPGDPPMASKEARAHAVTPEVESGNVYLPHPTLCPWVDTYIEELSSFPRSAYTDQTDGTTMALLIARKKMPKPKGTAPIVSVTHTSGWSSMSPS